jgi:hypothetical protein
MPISEKLKSKRKLTQFQPGNKHGPRFPKGNAPNPGGRPKVPPEYRKQARHEVIAMSEKLMEIFWRLMKMKNILSMPKQLAIALQIYSKIGDSIGWFSPHNPMLLQFNMGMAEGKDPNAALLQANLETGGMKQLLSVADIIAAATAGASQQDDNPPVETTSEVVEFAESEDDPNDAPSLYPNGHSNGGGIHPSTITRR